MKAAILTDLTKCVGCEACALACKEINELDRTSANNLLTAYTWSAVENRKGVNIRRQCMHCEEPACASACPVTALTKTPEGAVIYDGHKCMGCRYCMIACPFGIPKYQWDKAIPVIQKCIFCYEKALQKGEQPACTRACPTGATIFGERSALIAEAQRRMAAQPQAYVQHLYGLREAGGTSVFYLSAVPFADLGFPANMIEDPYPRLTWKVLNKIPSIVTTGAAFLAGLWWIVNRRIKLQESPEERS
ncbi:MAG TPA: 4Fe-4S dicluster domain-containing protein [bacterium]|nr:4Fe-4S dicluster domain-containing protein [bacterium]HPR87225.1 4Fe-4S dicluster domain-containing protein [bacterium]